MNLHPVAGRPRWLPLLAAMAGAASLTAAGFGRRRWQAGRQLRAQAKAYSQLPTSPARHLLVVGDSTGVGTGARAPADSVAGRIGLAHPDWRIDNLSENGARVADLAAQLHQVAGVLDLVLVMVGGNDVLRLSRWDQLQTDLLATVHQVQRRGGRVVLLPCGDVGHAPLIPPPISWWMQRRSDALHRCFDAVARATGAPLVDLRLPPDQDPFVQQPERYQAADGLHPSSEGYALWFQRLQQTHALR